MADPTTDIVEYFDACFGDTTGKLHIATGWDIHRTPTGKIKHKTWNETCFDYPAEANLAAQELTRATSAGADVYVCPYLTWTDKRGKGTAVARTVVHTDVDSGDIDAGKIVAFGGCAIMSGTRGHTHVYIQLSRPVTEAQHSALERALTVQFGGDPAKVSDNDVLRPPGTLNRKPTVDGNEPAPVLWMIRPNGHRADPDELAKRLKISLPEDSETISRTTAVAAAPEPIDLTAHPRVSEALMENTGDRSADQFRIVAVCYGAGLTLSQTRWVIASRLDLAQRLADRRDDDVLTSWLKVEEDRRHSAQLNYWGTGPASTNGYALEPIIDNANIDNESADQTQTWHDNNVSKRAYELRVTDEARALWTHQRASLMGQEPPTMVSLSDFLAVPDEDVKFRINDLLPLGGRALLAAQYKAGKTSLIANMLRSLVDGHPFLGRFDTTPVKRILLIDTELDERMLRRWLRDQTIRNTDHVNVMSLRGRLASFAINDDRTRAEWAKRIGGAELIVLDCLRPCLDALGLSEDKEAGVFLTAFDALCRECGASEAVVVHHMGHGQERSRGDSRLLDWPDVLWKIVRDTNDDGEDVETGDRFFSALGRDVNVPESQLDWQADTRALMICGGNRIDKKARTVFEDIEEILASPDHVDGLGRNELVKKLRTYGHSLHLARAALRRATEDGLLIIKKGSRNSNVHIINPSRTRSDQW